MKPAKDRAKKDQIERRRSERKEVLETFHVFLVVPEVGLRKMYLKDVSEHGLGFYGEPEDKFHKGVLVDCFFYIHPSLKLPLTFKVAHITEEEGRKRIGCEFHDKSSKAYKAFVAFMLLLDDLSEFLEA